MLVGRPKTPLVWPFERVTFLHVCFFFRGGGVNERWGSGICCDWLPSKVGPLFFFYRVFHCWGHIKCISSVRNKELKGGRWRILRKPKKVNVTWGWVWTKHGLTFQEDAWQMWKWSNSPDFICFQVGEGAFCCMSWWPGFCRPCPLQLTKSVLSEAPNSLKLFVTRWGACPDCRLAMRSDIQSEVITVIWFSIGNQQMNAPANQDAFSSGVEKMDDTGGLYNIHQHLQGLNKTCFFKMLGLICLITSSSTITSTIAPPKKS